MKLHSDGLKQFVSAGLSMLCYGCGVSQYPQFYDRDSDKYQVLPSPYKEKFEGFVEKNHKIKMKGRLGRSSRNIFW